MFLRRTERKKDGKSHSYWSIVENKRVERGRMVQRHVVYLGIDQIKFQLPPQPPPGSLLPNSTRPNAVVKTF